MWWMLVASAATIPVGSGGMPSIQRAVDAARDGDVIEVSAGRYDETVVIPESFVGTLTIEAVDGAEATTWGSDAGGASLVSNGTASLTIDSFDFQPDQRIAELGGGHLTLMNATATGLVCDGSGCAIEAVGQAHTTVLWSTFTDIGSTGGPGGMLSSQDGDVYVYGSTLSRGYSPVEGGCIYVDSPTGAGHLTLSGTELIGCAGLDGGAIYATSSDLTLSDASFEDNVALGDGGGLWLGGVPLQGNELSASRTTLSGNTAGGGGGGLFLHEVDADLANTDVLENHASEGAGYLALYSTLMLDESPMVGNIATGDGGGAMLKEGSILEGEVVVEGNTAGGRGGGLALHGARLEASLLRVVENEAEWGGGVAATDSALVLVPSLWLGNEASSQGGGLYWEAASDELVLHQQTFVDNEAPHGAGLFVEQGSVDVANTLVTGAASSAMAASEGASGSVRYCVLYDNGGAAVLDVPASVEVVHVGVEEPPQLEAAAPADDAYDYDVVPSRGSALIDGGDPAFGYIGAAGTLLDIGAFEVPYRSSEDVDGDKVVGPADCDDGDPASYPGAPEDCTEVDRNCDGDPYAGATDIAYQLDSDGDGYGAAATTVMGCGLGEGYALNGADCDDTDADVSPDGVEVCNRIDDNCDGQVDTDARVKPDVYRDADGDGVGAGEPIKMCFVEDGYATEFPDCDDSDPELSEAIDCTRRDQAAPGVATEDDSKGCHMVSGSAGATGWLMVVLLARRRSKEPPPLHHAE